MAYQESPVVATLNGAVGKDTTIDSTNGFTVNAASQAVQAGDLVQIGLQQFSVKAGLATAIKVVPQVPWTAPQRYDDKTPIILLATSGPAV
jgi:hypothetical protein